MPEDGAMAPQRRGPAWQAGHPNLTAATPTRPPQLEERRRKPARQRRAPPNTRGHGGPMSSLADSRQSLLGGVFAPEHFGRLRKQDERHRAPDHVIERLGADDHPGADKPGGDGTEP